jgi:hypothetical protein
MIAQLTTVAAPAAALISVVVASLAWKYVGEQRRV